MGCSYYTFRQGDYYCTKKGDYVSEDVYYKYCRNYDYGDCPIYKGDSSGGSCFLTSACVFAKGLPDDCYELQTLRHFRDTWLSAAEGGLSAISHYYIVAPKIVAAINKEANSREIYEMIYSKMIQPCVAFIERNKCQEAFDLYKKITLQLADEYC